jgi:hypothetical protein
MEQFCKSASRHLDRRGDDPRILEHERPLCVVVICPKLDWPSDLFAQNKDTVFKPLEKPTTEFHCACGCQQRHNCAISRVVAMDSDRHVLWYRTMRCRNKHAAMLAGVSLATIRSRGKVATTGQIPRWSVRGHEGKYFVR